MITFLLSYYKMKRTLLLSISAFLILACSPQKNTAISRNYQNFKAYYNTLFNSKDALESEIQNRKENHQDNFYSPFIPLLTYDEQPLGNEVSGSAFFSQNDTQPPRQGSGTLQKSASVLEIAEAKALKAIQNHSMLYDGKEQNKRMFDAHLLLAQSRLYQGKSLEALNALNYIFSNMPDDKDINLAKIYQGEAYAKMGDYYRADEVFSGLKATDLNKDEARLLSVYYAQMLLNSGKKQEAVAELEEAFSITKNRNMRSRIAFLRGQILNDLGKPEEARESFVTAYKYANDFEFEVKAQIEIAKTFNGNTEDYNGAKDYLEKISKKGTYASRKNEFYYALGLMATKAGKLEDAKEFYTKALKEKPSDSQIRGLTYYELGQQYFNNDDYISAGAYYDSAVTAMTYEPTRNDVELLARNIKNVTKNYYLIKKNDSILALSKMSEPQRQEYFSKYIADLKAKEAKTTAENLRKNRETLDTRDFGINENLNNDNKSSGFNIPGFGSSFYFDNQTAIAKGSSTFKQVWGNRSLVDNWRFSNTVSSIEDKKNEAMGMSSVANPRRFETDYYIEKIPTDSRILGQLKVERDTASLGLGRMYEDYFTKTKLATKTLYDLVDNQPEKEVKLQALYQIFDMNYQDNPGDAQRAKQIILEEFPYTSYAEFVKNPKSSSFSKSSPEMEATYQRAFALYEEGKYEDSQKLIAESLQQYPNDALVPKFSLLNAFNTGKTAGKEIMILQLQQIALNYNKTPEGEKAQEMLNYLKSELNDSGFSANSTAPSATENTADDEDVTSTNTYVPKPKLPRNEEPRQKVRTRINNTGVGIPDQEETPVSNPYAPPKRK